MKINLQFTFPDDRDEFEMSYNGPGLHIIVREFDEHMRKIVKYAGDDVPEIVLETVEELRTDLHDRLESAGIHIYF